MQNKHTVAVATSGTHNKPLMDDDDDDESSCVLAACFITVRKTEKKGQI